MLRNFIRNFQKSSTFWIRECVNVDALCTIFAGISRCRLPSTLPSQWLTIFCRNLDRTPENRDKEFLFTNKRYFDCIAFKMSLFPNRAGPLQLPRCFPCMLLQLLPPLLPFQRRLNICVTQI